MAVHCYLYIWTCIYVAYRFIKILYFKIQVSKLFKVKHNFRRGLIMEGMMAWSRNLNYLGEIMIYGSFVLLVNDSLSYILIVQVWVVVFSLRMYAKEISFKKKE